MIKVYNPHSLAELAEGLKEMRRESKIVSGGTDIIIKLHQRTIKPDALLNLSNVPELKQIRVEGGIINIGAGCSFNQIAKSSLIPLNMQAIKDAAGDIGSPQIRSLGTIGGNIANASPAGDMLPLLFLLQAEIAILNPDGNIVELPVNKVVLGPGKTCLNYNQAIINVKIPMLDENYLTAFTKLGFRNKVTIARIGVAAVFSGQSDILRDIKIYMGAISPVPIRAEKVERCFKGQKIDETAENNGFKAMRELIMENTPEEFDRAYKLQAARGVVADICGIMKRTLH